MMKSDIFISVKFVLLSACLYVSTGAELWISSTHTDGLSFGLPSNGSCVEGLDELDVINTVPNINNSRLILDITVMEDSSKCIALFDNRWCSKQGISLQFHNVTHKNFRMIPFKLTERPLRPLNYKFALKSIQQCSNGEDMNGIGLLFWKSRFCEKDYRVIFETVGPSGNPNQYISKIWNDCVNLRARDKNEQFIPNSRTSLVLERGLTEDICLEMYTDIHCEGEMARWLVSGDIAFNPNPMLLWQYVVDGDGRPMIDTDVRSIRKCGPCLKTERPEQCNFLNCLRTIDLLTLSDLGNSENGQRPCYFFFNSSQCTSRPIIIQTDELHLPLIKQVLGEFSEFVGWSLADCYTHGYVPEDCLVPVEAGRTLLDLFPVLNFTTGSTGPTSAEEAASDIENILIYVGVGFLLLLLVMLALWKFRSLIRKIFENQSPSERVTSLSIRSHQTNSYQIARDTFTIDGTTCLGSGAFGKVCRGKLRTDSMGEMEDVAVKMVKESCPEIGLNGLMYEIKILTKLKEHPHIVKLKGTYVENKEIFVFLELCELGSLKDHLRSIEPPPTNTSTDGTYYVDLETGNKILSGLQCGGLDDSIVTDIVRWSAEIANGLEFLASQRIVHMDIATRNILLSSDKRAKITDFGLSRRLYDYQSYLKKQQEPLPWRWMAPESLRRLEFTEKSDVWAFGVTLWEIFTLGDEPYPGLAWDVNFSAKLENGLRLGEPRYNLNGVYAVMCRCWDMNPGKRPTFSELEKLLAQNSMQV